MTRLTGGVVTVSLLVLLTPRCAPWVCAQDKLDLDFEHVSRNRFPSDWTVNPQYPFDLVESVVKNPRYVRSGEAAVKLVKVRKPGQRDARGHLHTRKDIPARRGERYVLTLWARGEGQVGVLAYAYGPKDNGAVGFLRTVSPRPLKDTPADGTVSDADWQCYRYEFDLRDDQTGLTSLRLVIAAAGTVYVDAGVWVPVREGQTAAAPASAAEPQREALRSNFLTLPLSVTPPAVDGQFGPEEYAVSATGLVNQGTHGLYEYPVRFGMSRDTRRLYFGLALDLPATYTLQNFARRRDEAGLVATQDVFYLMIRPDEAIDASTYEGVYLAVTPDGVVYDAWEAVSWSQGYCRRDASFNADWKVATRGAKGQWTLELSVPFSDLRLSPRSQPTFLLSFGMNLRNGAVAWQVHPNWFDHPQAFGRVRLADDALTVRAPAIGELARGRTQPSFELVNAGRASAPYEITYLVSTPRMIGGRVGSYIFDVAMDVRQKAIVGDRSVYHWHREGVLPSAGRRNEQDSGQLASPGSYVLESEIRSGGRSVFYQKVPFAYVPPLTVTLTPLPSRDQVVANMSFHGARPEQKGRVRIRFLSAAGENGPVWEQAVAADEMTLSLPMAKLNPGDYNVEFTLTGKDVRTAATTAVPFRKWAAPVWLTDRAGIEALEPNWVPDPWEPVAVKAGRVTVWGRQFGFGAGSLVANLTSQNEPLLAGGVTIHYETGGRSHDLTLDMPRLSSLGRGRVQVEQRGSSPHFNLTVRQRIEFDGMDRVDLRLSPRQATQVDRLWITVPFRNLPYSMLMANEGPGSQHWQRGLATDDLFATPRAFNVIWLGNDKAGCAFFTENYKGWVVDSTRPRVSLVSNQDVRRLNLLLVNGPASVDRPLEITFGLHPTPFKPFYSGWRDLRPQGLGIEPPPVSAAFVHASLWNSCDSKPSPRNWQVLEDIVRFTHGRKQKAYPYLGTFFISPYDNLRRNTSFDPAQARFPESQLLCRKADATRQEEFFYFAEDWHVRPARVNEPEAETRQEVRTAAGTSWADYFVHGVAEMLKRTDVDGFYLDIANPIFDMNEGRGLTVVTKDGKREGTVELFAARDLYKRLYRVFEQHRGPSRRPWLFGHGFAVSVPYSPFWDANFNCEEVKPSKAFEFTAMNLQRSLEGAPSARREDAEGVRSFDAFAFRAHFGQQFGLPNVVLPQYGYNPTLKTAAHSREMLAWTFMHNNILWPAYIPAQPVYAFWSKVEVPFGMGDAVFQPYWRNGIAVEPTCVRVSCWSKPNEKDYLLAAANWSSQPASATIVLPGALCRFGRCVDMESGESLPCRESLRASIPAFDLRVFRFQAADGR